MSNPGSSNALAIYLGVVQPFFATTWPLYVLYSPHLAPRPAIASACAPAVPTRLAPLALARRARRAAEPAVALDACPHGERTGGGHGAVSRYSAARRRSQAAVRAVNADAAGDGRRPGLRGAPHRWECFY